MAEAFRFSIAGLVYEAARRQLDRRTEECWELLNEVIALEAETQRQARVIESLYESGRVIDKFRADDRDDALAIERHVRTELREAWDENALLRAENARWRARVTLGGIPPVSGAPHWRNVAAPPVPIADGAPPLRRSDTSSSFRGGESRG